MPPQIIELIKAFTFELCESGAPMAARSAVRKSLTLRQSLPSISMTRMRDDPNLCR